MIFIPSHPEGKNYFKFFTRPWMRLRLSPGVRFRYSKQITDFLIIVSALARPENSGEILFRFRLVDDHLSLQTYVSDHLRDTDFEYSLELLTKFQQIAWTKLEVLRNEY